MEDEGRSVAVSPLHTVLLASEMFLLIERAPRVDFVVRTLARREANGLPLMTAEMVIAGAGTREAHPAAATYPLHFRKTYHPGRLHGETSVEFEAQLLASRLTKIPPPIGHAPNVFRSCLVPAPFGADPPESNIGIAEKQSLATVAGLWRLAEETLTQFTLLHEGGLAHGDAELHNCIISHAPLEPVLIDFESAVRRDSVDQPAWERRRELDLAPLLREAIYLQCALGAQPSALGELSRKRLTRLFERPEPFRHAIETQGRV
jgi:hypothetical protein